MLNIALDEAAGQLANVLLGKEALSMLQQFHFFLTMRVHSAKLLGVNLLLFIRACGRPTIPYTEKLVQETKRAIKHS